MAKHKRGQGAPRGATKDRGSGRGGGGGGRGGGHQSPDFSRGRGRGRGGFIPMELIEQPVQLWQEANIPGRQSPYGGGFRGSRGRGNNHRGFSSPQPGPSTPKRVGASTPTPRGGPTITGFYRTSNSAIPPALEEPVSVGRGSPSYSPRGWGGGRGRGRGRGYGGWGRGGGGGGGGGLEGRLRSGAPLSKMLYEDRPYLKPVKFVRSAITATLFTNEEELLQPIQESAGDAEASHVPTADKVAQIFGGDVGKAEEGIGGGGDDGGGDSSSDEELEVIDFSEIGKLQAQVDAPATSRSQKRGQQPSEPSTSQTQFAGFYIDINPTFPSASSSTIVVDRMQGVLGVDDQLDSDEEVIVYDAPQHRIGSINPPTTLEDVTPSEPAPTSTFAGLVQSALAATETTPESVPAQDEAVGLILQENEGHVGITTTAIIANAPFEDLEPTTQTRTTPDEQPLAGQLDAMTGIEPSEPSSPVSSITLVTTQVAESATDGIAHHEPVAVEASTKIDVSVEDTPSSVGPLPYEEAEDHPMVTQEVPTTVAVTTTTITTTTTTTTTTTATEGSTTQIQLTLQSTDPTPALLPSSTSTPTPIPQPPNFSSLVFTALTSPAPKQTRRLHPANTPRALLRSRGKKFSKKKKFAAFGAMVAEERLREREEEEGWKGRRRDPRWREQRVGDDDVDWGDDDDDDGDDGDDEDVGGVERREHGKGKGKARAKLGEDDANVDEISEGLGGMEIDEDLDLAAMQRFVKSMSAEGSKHVTMEDLADIEKLKREDEEEEEGEGDSEDESEGDDEEEEDGEDDDDDDESTDEELEAVFQLEERVLTGDGVTEGDPNLKDKNEGKEDEDDDDVSEDEDEDGDEEVTPSRRFQARVEKMRRKDKGKQKAKFIPKGQSDDDDDDEGEDNEEEDFDMELDGEWADNDEAYIAHIQKMLDNNADILSDRDRKQRSKIFDAVHNGDWDHDEYEEFMGRPAKRKKDKKKGLPSELQALWEKDRQKKAENKRKRALLRLQASADPLSPNKKSGKKAVKAMLKLSRLAADGDPSLESLPNKVVDFNTLEQQIRRFLADIGGPTQMPLPPADKATRKKIHELAIAFNLNSASKGKGTARYTTLIKTSRSGEGMVDEERVGKIMKWMGKRRWEGAGGGGKHGKAMSLAKHREGEEVGKAAPKIGSTNVGFKMLAAMGWSEGDRIGLASGGALDAPLVAIMKKTKLGLGALPT